MKGKTERIPNTDLSLYQEYENNGYIKQLYDGDKYPLCANKAHIKMYIREDFPREISDVEYRRLIYMYRIMSKEHRLVNERTKKPLGITELKDKIGFTTERKVREFIAKCKKLGIIAELECENKVRVFLLNPKYASKNVFMDKYCFIAFKDYIDLPSSVYMEYDKMTRNMKVRVIGVKGYDKDDN